MSEEIIARYLTVLQCPICEKLLSQPTRIRECLHAFCKNCILKQMESAKGSSYKCPCCSEKIINTLKPWNVLACDKSLESIITALSKSIQPRDAIEKKECEKTEIEKKETEKDEKGNPTLIEEKNHAQSALPSTRRLICVKLRTRRTRMEKELLDKFPIRSFFQVPESAKLEILEKLSRKLLQLGNDEETLELRAPRPSRGIGAKLSLSITLSDLIRQIGWKATNPLEIYVELTQNSKSYRNSGRRVKFVNGTSRTEPMNLFTPLLIDYNSLLKSAFIDRNTIDIQMKAQTAAIQNDLVSAGLSQRIDQSLISANMKERDDPHKQRSPNQQTLTLTTHSDRREPNSSKN